MRRVGIDPGANGAIAIVDDHLMRVLIQRVEFFDGILFEPRIKDGCFGMKADHCTMEKMFIFPGTTGNHFKLGSYWGQIHAWAVSVHGSVNLVTTKAWHKQHGIVSAERKEMKAQSKAKAHEVFAKYKIEVILQSGRHVYEFGTDDDCEAALIALAHN